MWGKSNAPTMVERLAEFAQQVGGDTFLRFQPPSWTRQIACLMTSPITSLSPCTQIPDSRLLILKSFPVFNCKVIAL